MDTAVRWPLLVDPQQQALRYLKELGKNVPEGVEVIRSLQTPNFMRTIELGVQFGKWIVLENVPNDFSSHPNFPALEPLLHASALLPSHSPLCLQTKATQTKTLRLSAEKLVARAESFRFVVTCDSMPLTHHSIRPHLCVIDFTISPKVLENAVLSHICARELPEHEERYMQLTCAATKATRDRLAVEAEMLALLQTKRTVVAPSGRRRSSVTRASVIIPTLVAGAIPTMPTIDILDDEQCVNALLGAKMQLEQVRDKIVDGTEARQDVERCREEYRPVAARGVAMYNALCMLREVGKSYEFGYVTQFMRLVSEATDEAPASPVLSSRLQYLQHKLCNKLYNYACKGMFHKHRTLLGLCMALHLENATPEEITFIRTCSQHGDDPLAKLSSLPEFSGVDKDENLKLVIKEATLSVSGPPLGPFPKEWAQLNPWRRLLIVYALRPDFLSMEIDTYVNESVFGGTGEGYAGGPAPFSGTGLLTDSSPHCPTILIESGTQSGYTVVSREARIHGLTSRFESISLGGDVKKAQRLIEEGQTRGMWVLLENCHLGYPSYVHELCAPSLVPEELHRDFRLFLSTVSGEIPRSILVVGVKVVLEPPESIQQNLIQVIRTLPIDPAEHADAQEAAAQTLEKRDVVYTCALFHAVLQERIRLMDFPYSRFPEDHCALLCHAVDTLDELRQKASIVYSAECIESDKSSLQCIIDIFIDEREQLENRGFVFPEEGAALDDIVANIENMPPVEPEQVGLHPNWEIACEMSILHVLRDLEETSSQAVRKDLPQRLPVSVGTGTLALFFSQEVERYNALLTRIERNLEEMSRIDTAELEAVKVGRVPDSWSRHSYVSSRSLASWMADLHARIAYFRTIGSRAIYYVNFMWDVCGFFNALKVQRALAQKTVVGSLAIDFVFLTAEKQEQLEKSDEKCEDPVIAGFTLHGARFTTQVAPLPVGKQLTDSLRACTMKMRPRGDALHERHVMCPVFKVLPTCAQNVDGNFVMTIPLPCEDPSAFKIGRVFLTLD